MAIIMKAVHSYEKCFLDDSIDSKALLEKASALRGEKYYYEIAYTADSGWVKEEAWIKIDSPIAELVGIEKVEVVPVRYACYPGVDDNYISKKPGLYPDLLTPKKDGDKILAVCGQLQSLFITVNIPSGYPAGEYPVTISFVQGEKITSSTVTLNIIAADLPEQTMTVTNWFHTDCIGSIYGVETWSEKHWEYIENFVRTAVEHGINAILMPTFTPALDTAVGKERPTTQLVDVYKDENGYRFGFDRVERWVEMCSRCGVQYFEVAHLYTQWGARHAPKVMAYVNGEYKKIFGWETDSLGDEYREFLRAYLTAFLKKMKALGGADKRCLFHISDEPGLDVLEQYKKAKAQVADILKGYTIMDALSNFEFYSTGALDNPVPANNHIEPFIEAKVPNLWTYYCCSQGDKVSNRFIAMPMGRTRVIGVQFYKFNIVGFLQWGYNFWYSQYSDHEINPYVITEGDYFTPAGDEFIVYPGKNGRPEWSLHGKAFSQSLTDMRAMQLAETLCGREAVMNAVEGDLETKITFKEYPTDNAYAETVREKVNALIAQALK